MTKNNQIVSILTPSFNHEKYVSFFIDSVLAQTNPNWELIIVDDCSSDNNVAEILKYSDPRIKLIKHDYNQGINAAINTAFEMSSGNYLALCASDDALDKNYVDDIIKTMNKKNNVGVIYYRLQGMDCDNKIISNRILKSPYQNKYEALRNSFYNGNSYVSPGMCFRREVFEKVYPLNLALSVYQDYKLHIDLISKNDVYLSNKPLVLYRIPSEQSGISFFSEVFWKRCQLEENLLMDSFLKIDDIQILKKIFGNDLIPYGKISKDLLPYILGSLALNSNNEYKKIWGYNQISEFLGVQKNYDKVNKLYGFCYKDFLSLANKFIEKDKMRDPIKKLKKKVKKYKRLFVTSIIINLLFILSYLIYYLK